MRPCKGIRGAASRDRRLLSDCRAPRPFAAPSPRWKGLFDDNKRFQAHDARNRLRADGAAGRMVADLRVGRHRAAAAAAVRAAAHSGRRLPLDAGLLAVGPERRRLQLGAGHLGAAARLWHVVDAGLLGLRRRRLPVARRLLGHERGLLRRPELRLRLQRQRLLGRTLGSRPFPLQPVGQQPAARPRAQRLQHAGGAAPRTA